MRFVTIFLLHLQTVVEHKSRAFVWFLIAVINPLLLILFWQGSSVVRTVEERTFIATYYLSFTVASALLMVHIEDEVAEIDIFEGHMSQYLLKPYSYFLFKFFQEIPNRLLQGFFGVCMWLLFAAFLPDFIKLSGNPWIVSLGLLSAIFAYCVSFTFKMVIGLLAFWLDDMQATFQFVDALLLLFAGYIVPLTFMPERLYTIATFLPFAYMLYYPITILQGSLSLLTVLHILITQLIWIAVLSFLYMQLWRMGMKKFSGEGI